MTEVLQKLSLKHELRGSVLNLFNTLNQLNIDLTSNAYSEEEMAELIYIVEKFTKSLSSDIEKYKR